MKIIFGFWFFLLTIGSASAETIGSVTALSAWVREAPPGASVMAAYMTLSNVADHSKVLVSVGAKEFERAELHETVFESGHAIMRRVSSLTIPPHGQITLSPGGYHVMLIRPQRSFPEGSQVSMELKFKDGDVIHLNALVKSALTRDPYNPNH